MYKYVFFDLDGTITEPEEGIINGVLYALSKFGIMFVWLIACIAAGCVIQPVAALVVAGITILMFFYYRFMSYRTFGGITGDLAGYFLQMCELWMLIGTVVLVHVI